MDCNKEKHKYMIGYNEVLIFSFSRFLLTSGRSANSFVNQQAKHVEHRNANCTQLHVYTVGVQQRSLIHVHPIVHIYRYLCLYVHVCVHDKQQTRPISVTQILVHKCGEVFWIKAAQLRELITIRSIKQHILPSCVITAA